MLSQHLVCLQPSPIEKPVVEVTGLGSAVSDDVVIERVVPTPPRRTTQLDEDLSRQLKHFSELRQKYALSERDRQRQIREEEARRAISCDNHRQWERGLTRRMRRQMRVTPQVALEAEPELSSSEEEEEEEEEPALPELTPEMEVRPGDRPVGVSCMVLFLEKYSLRCGVSGLLL